MVDEKCIDCEEVITNPLCPFCLQQGIKQWLRERGETVMCGEVEELTRSVFANKGSTFCVKCNSLMSLCVYCYTKDVFSVVRDIPELLPQYLVYFNFDLEHQGWEKDAEIVMEYG